MPIYKISPKAAKSPDHNSDSKGQRFEFPRPHHTKTPCTFKKVNRPILCGQYKKEACKG